MTNQLNTFFLDGVEERTLFEMQNALRAGLTSRAIVEAYLDRIARLDRSGTCINSVLEVNPEAPQIAEALDHERRRGQIRGSLHGIPIVVKDNINTDDLLNTTAGSQLFFGNRVASDATVIGRLRDAGAIILGKTVMNEFATGDAPASRGGIVRNPYALDRTVSGSSSGSAAAVAANFAAAAVGTDTRGSLRYPAADCAIVSLRPTIGFISRAGVLPLDYTIDTVGPMARTVTDLALMLEALAGFDQRDPVTARIPDDTGANYVRFLEPHALASKRIGVLRSAVNEPVGNVFDQAVRDLARLGAHLVEDLQIKVVEYGGSDPQVREIIQAMDLVAVEIYLKDLHPESPIHSLDELEYVVRARPYPTLVDLSGPLQYRASRSWRRLADEFDTFLQRYEDARISFVGEQRSIVEDVFSRHTLDAIVFPTKFAEPPSLFMTFDPSEQIGPSEIASYAGLPELTVPAGYCSENLPVGLSFLGRAFSESLLLALGYSFESATRHRRPPRLPNQLPSIGALMKNHSFSPEVS